MGFDLGAPRLAWVFDDGFVDCTLVALHSALRVTPGPMTAHLLHVGPVRLTEADLDPLRRAYPLADLRLMPLDLPQVTAAFTGTAHDRKLPVAACGRLLLPQLLQGRVLYLDGDVLLRKDPTPLWHMDLGDKALGACLAPGVQAKLSLAAASYWRRSQQARRSLALRAERLGGLDLGRYFNSGVLLLDLDRIRALRLDAPMGQIARAAELPSLDQDWLNIVFRDAAQLLPPEWNSGWGSARTAASYVPAKLRELFRPSREDPALVHFTGREKPWQHPSPPFRLHMLTKALERRQRRRFWEEYQAARRQTQSLLQRPLFGAMVHPA